MTTPTPAAGRAAGSRQDGDELALTGSGGDRLQLEARDGIYSSRTTTPLDEARAARVGCQAARRQMPG